MLDIATHMMTKQADEMSHAEGFSCSQGYLDELAWGAAWLYKATKDTQYLTDAKASAPGM